MNTPDTPFTDHDDLLAIYSAYLAATLATGDPHPGTSLQDALDYEDVAWTAINGPRNPQTAHHILTTPHLLALLRQDWDEQPPTPQLRAHLNTTPHGQQLLGATGHDHPADEHLSQDAIDHVVFNFECMLAIAAFDPTLTFRGELTHTLQPSSNHPNLNLLITRTTNPDTDEPQLAITTPTPAYLTSTGHLTWTLTATLTHPNGKTTSRTSTQIITPNTAPYWIIDTPRTSVALTHITLAPGQP